VVFPSVCPIHAGIDLELMTGTNFDVTSDLKKKNHHLMLYRFFLDPHYEQQKR